MNIANTKRYDNILVGGSGFIGTALVSLLSRKHETVVSISREKHNVPSGVDTIMLNVDDMKSLEDNFPQGENVFILIGQNSTTFNPDQELRNIKNLIVILNKTLPKKVFYFSSALIYGELETPAQELDTPNPIDIYSSFKYEAEQLLQKSLNPAITIGILRLANVYGNPRNRGFITFLMHRLFEQAGGKISVNGDGSQERDYMFIDDVVMAIVAVRDRLQKRDIVNIATGESHTIIELIDHVSRVTLGQLPYELNGKKLTEVVKSRISNATLTDKYRYTPKYSLQEGILKTLKHYQEQ